MGARTDTAGPADGLAERLAGDWAQRIEQRLILPGARLPSVREGARQQGVSPYTVVAAYDRLQALGLVEARRQRGFFVREPREAHRARAASSRPPPAPAAAPPFDALTLMRSLMGHEQGPQGVGPAHGTLPPAWFDAQLLRQALRQVLAQDHGGRRPTAAALRPARRRPAAARCAEQPPRRHRHRLPTRADPQHRRRHPWP